MDICRALICCLTLVTALASSGAAQPAPVSVPVLTAYVLPRPVSQPLLGLADRSDVLVFGEIHGTQQVPEVVGELLPALKRRGYRALALEVPADQRAALADWASGKSATAPPFYAHPGQDGRGNVQMLGLVRQAVRSGWALLCFDVTAPVNSWAARDAGMAQNLTAQRRQFCPVGKVVAVCGNLHSRVANHAPAGNFMSKLWPSFAASLQQREPTRTVSSVDIVPHAGGFFNGGRVQEFTDTPLPAPELRQTPDGDHTAEMHLPSATPATFLSPPH